MWIATPARQDYVPALQRAVRLGARDGVGALTQASRGAVSFVLPNFHELDAILDIIERDNAGAVLVVPEWPYEAWWRRLHLAAWTRRVAA